MGKKEETTNLIGRKGSKMTVKSNVKTKAKNWVWTPDKQ